MVSLRLPSAFCCGMAQGEYVIRRAIQATTQLLGLVSHGGLQSFVGVTTAPLQSRNGHLLGLSMYRTVIGYLPVISNHGLACVMCESRNHPEVGWCQCNPYYNLLV